MNDAASFLSHRSLDSDSAPGHIAIVVEHELGKLRQLLARFPTTCCCRALHVAIILIRAVCLVPDRFVLLSAFLSLESHVAAQSYGTPLCTAINQHSFFFSD
jgi:hypothetical protein